MHRLVRISREDYYIAFLAVYQQVQTRGVGTALMKRAEEERSFVRCEVYLPWTWKQKTKMQFVFTKSAVIE